MPHVTCLSALETHRAEFQAEAECLESAGQQSTA